MEDPATGGANGALVALLASLEPAADASPTFDILQGVEMVGGRCTPVIEEVLAV